MNRRAFLAATGVGVAGAAGAWFLAGPSEDGGSSYDHPGTLDETFARSGDFPENDNPADGYPPEFSDPPAAPEADPATFERLDVNGESVSLAPIDAVERWYRRGEARFVDARGLGQYEQSHVYGAVCSPAQQRSEGGPIDAWPTDDRIVTYCGCPHHLSSLRAAGLLKGGHAEVYALDEGYREWRGRSYPMAGTDFVGENADVSEWTLEGVATATHAGRYAWAAADRQYEAAPIDDDGRFTLHLRFADVTSETPIEVSTPDYSVTRPLGELAAATIDGR